LYRNGCASLRSLANRKSRKNTFFIAVVLLEEGGFEGGRRRWINIENKNDGVRIDIAANGTGLNNGVWDRPGAASNR